MMLIDTRDRRPQPRPRGTVLSDLLGWLFPWPAIVFWLWIGGVVLTDVPGMLFAVGALLVSFWRVAKAYPAWGLSDHRQ